MSLSSVIWLVLWHVYVWLVFSWREKITSDFSVLWQHIHFAVQIYGSLLLNVTEYIVLFCAVSHLMKLVILVAKQKYTHKK